MDEKQITRTFLYTEVILNELHSENIYANY